MAFKRTWEKCNGTNRRIIHLKCIPSEFDAAKAGLKAFEIRSEDDGKFSLNDLIQLHKLNSRGEVEEFSPTIRFVVNYIFRTPGYGVQEGYAILGITPAPMEKRYGGYVCTVGEDD
jgi:hypothetical protein